MELRGSFWDGLAPAVRSWDEGIPPADSGAELAGYGPALLRGQQ
jgi:hypothetical protein